MKFVTLPKILNLFARGLMVLLAACFFAVSAHAQSSTDGSTPLGQSSGSPSGSYPLSDFDTVNLYNGSLNMRLPLLKIGGRGEAGYPITLHVEKKWTVYKHFEPGVGTFYYPDGGWWSEENDGWRIFEAGKVDIRSARREQPQGFPVETLTRITFSAPDGTEYELRDQLTNGQPVSPQAGGFNRGKIFVTSDGSGATFISDWDILDDPTLGQGFYDDRPDGYLMLRDGTRFRVEDGKIMWMRDRNGNKVTFTYDFSRRVTSITDSLARQVTITYPTSIPGITEITYKGFGGASRSIKIGQTNLANALRSGYTVQTVSQLFPELHGGGAVDSTVVNYVELPDGRRYQFEYNSHVELARVVLPTGGAIEYDYAAGLTDGYTSGVFSIGTKKFIYRRVIERRVYPDGGTGSAYASRMTYSRPETNTTNAGYVITEQRDNAGALLAKSQHYFHGSPRASFNQEPTHYAAWQDGREYQTDSFHTNGTTVLRRVTNTFEQRAEVSWWTGTDETEPPNDARLKGTTTMIEPTGANLVAKQTFGYDDSVPYNNQNNVKEYDFASGTPGALLRETRTTFVTATNYTSTDVHLRSLPLQVSIHDGNGVERARASSEFDNYATDTNHAALLHRSGISGLDSAFSVSYTTRGNATANSQYLLVNGSVTGSVTGYAQYDIAGNVVKTIDGRGHSVTLDFSDRFGGPDGEARGNTGATELAGLTSYAFPTLVTNSLGHTTYTQFDYYLGRPVDSEDANGIVASGYYNNSLDRPKQIISAANQGTSVKSQTTFDYDDENRVITTTSDQSAFGDNLLKSQLVYDGLGRTTDKRQYESASAYITVRQTYDAAGRNYQTSNPFRVGESVVWTTTAYDALSRVISVTTPDNAVVGTAYSGDRVLVTDQAGKQRVSKTNALGQLKDLWEVTAPDSATESISFPNHPEVTAAYRTSYNYDTLNNLTKVTQGSQPAREFAYDSLKRLTSAFNPESGTISYQYDNNGNLLVKTDARGVSSHYEYDALNRASRRWYNGSSALTATTHNSPALPSGVGASDEAKYFYDSQSIAGAPAFDRGYSTGRLVATTYGGGNSGDYFGFDAAGRAKLKIQQTGGINYQTTAIYNLADAMTSMSYPSGRTITNTFDNAGRLNSFSGDLGDGTQRTYATGILYSSFGGKTKEQFGTNTPLYNKSFYNSRGQLAEIRVGTSYTGPSDTGWERGAIINHYSDTCWGMCGGPNSTTAMTNNNGNLKKQDVYIPDNDPMTSYTMRWQQYDYDSLNRLKWVRENSGSSELWKQEFVYDRYGNRTIHQTNTWGVAKPNFGVDPNTNRLTAPAGSTMTYDAAGNLTFDNSDGIGGTRTYDAENKMKQAWSNNQWQTYAYDGDGRRIKRIVNGAETWQVYGLGGELLAEYSANGAASSPQKEYGYRNGELLISTDPPVSQSYVLQPLVVGKALGAQRADSPGWTGFKMTVGSQPISVNSLGRQCSSGNSLTHELRLIRVSDNSVVASTNVAMSGCAVGHFKYANLANPVTLAANTAYLLVSYEIGSDLFHDWTGTALTTTSAATVNHGVYTIDGGQTWGPAGSTGNSYVPLDLQYQVPPSQPLVTGKTLGAQRADSPGWTGLKMTVGSQPMTVTKLGRHCSSGNSLTHELRLIRVSDNSPVASTNVAMSGCGVGQFKYADLTNPVTLAANTAYLLVSYEVGSDLFHDWTNTVLTTASAATINHGIYTIDGGQTWGPAGGTGSSYIPLDLQYQTGSITSVNIRWLVNDQLGTPRMVFDQTGSLANVSRHDYLPFGEELFAGTGGRTTVQGYGGDNVRQKFTSKERDNETGLDYFLARYYSSNQGRFTSPDEFSGGPDDLYDFADDASENPTFYAELDNPQSLNKYQYTYNNPLNMTDNDGHTPSCEPCELIRPLAPALPLIPAIPVAGPTAIAVAAAAVIYTAIPGDPTGGDGSCRSCDAGVNAYRRQLDREADKQNIRNQDNSANQGQAEGGLGGNTGKGSRNPNTAEAAKEGRAQHKDFAGKVKAKAGWKSEPTLRDPATGKRVRPDAVTPSGRPVELKPNTPSGRSQGRRQLPGQERATGKRGRVVYYEPKRKQPE